MSAEAAFQLFEGCNIVFHPKDLIPSKVEHCESMHHPFDQDLLYQHVHTGNVPAGEYGQNMKEVGEMSVTRDITSGSSHHVIGLKVQTAYVVMPTPDVPFETITKWFENDMLSLIDQRLTCDIDRRDDLDADSASMFVEQARAPREPQRDP